MIRHEVFISYSSKDKATADAICHYLEQDGIRCWIAPRDIPPGAKYASAIVEGLDAAAVMLVLFTENACSSDHVGNEVDLAFTRNKTIIPFRVADVTPSGVFEYYLRSMHWLDAFPGAPNAHFERLANSIRAVAGVATGATRETSASETAAVQQPPAVPPKKAKPWRLVLWGLEIACVLAAISWFVVLPLLSDDETPAPSDASPVAGVPSEATPEVAANSGADGAPLIPPQGWTVGPLQRVDRSVEVEAVADTVPQLQRVVRPEMPNRERRTAATASEPEIPSIIKLPRKAVKKDGGETDHQARPESAPPPDQSRSLISMAP